jgi:ATP-dependent exoDNAse (exonuclease V) alpha subunit
MDSNFCEKTNVLKLNEQQKFALDKMKGEDQVYFLTGKAGTGKSTVIKEYIKSCGSGIILVAPTGIAAFNIGGNTIHRQFRIDPGLYTQDRLQFRFFTGPDNEAEIIKRADAIIIDEVSMVRSDLMEAVNVTLMNICSSDLPFGGKKIILVGDLYQLPPVATSFEKNILMEEYGGIFFFNAPVFKKVKIELLQLVEVQRQKDVAFVDALNMIRGGEYDQKILDMLNSRVSNEQPPDTTVLTPYNEKVNQINTKMINSLKGDVINYEANITGRLSESEMPTSKILGLKVGAQVVFLKNDPYRKYVNGTLGVVSDLLENSIDVQLSNGQLVTVERYKWAKTSYVQVDKNITSEITAIFEQFPLRLAWALTIHKTQGMTLDRMHLDLGRGTFESGHLYVALSRVKTLEGLTLQRPICPADINANSAVKKFIQQLEISNNGNT